MGEEKKDTKVTEEKPEVKEEKKVEEKVEEKTEYKFPTEVIDLPSEGKIYSKDSPLNKGQIEIRYMTAREEDILTSANLIKKGVVLQHLLDSLIVTPGITSADLILGDKNAVMVAARILAYGPDYKATITHPDTYEESEQVFDLTKCPFKKIPEDVLFDENNEITIELPVAKFPIKCKILTARDEENITKEVNSYKKTGISVLPEVTTRLRHSIMEVNGKRDQNSIDSFVQNLLSRDSLFLRQEMNRIAPNIDLVQEIDLEGDMIKVEIPLTMDFFWPQSI